LLLDSNLISVWKQHMDAIAIDPRTEEAVKRFLSRIAGRYDMAGAVLYGSRARGTYRPDSDADLAVLLRGERQRLLPTTLAMADVAYDVLLETGTNITPLPIWTDEWENPDTYSNPALLRNIAREGITFAGSRNVRCHGFEPLRQRARRARAVPV
jgi:predicted nucleotidyltransferase